MSANSYVRVNGLLESVEWVTPYYLPPERAMNHQELDVLIALANYEPENILTAPELMEYKARVAVWERDHPMYAGKGDWAMTKHEYKREVVLELLNGRQ